MSPWFQQLINSISTFGVRNPLLWIILVLIVIIVIRLDPISNYDLTRTRITLTEVRVKDYWQSNNRLPGQLSDLTPLPNRDNSTIDGWGRQIQYTKVLPSTFTLSSLGRDGVIGGADEDSDLTFTFDASQP